jgi:hypothetical protein
VPGDLVCRLGGASVASRGRPTGDAFGAEFQSRCAPRATQLNF